MRIGIGKMRSLSVQLRSVTLVVGCLLLAACATTPAATGPQVEPLTNRHFAPTQTVDVLGAMPERSFTRVARLTLADPTGSATREQLVAQLANVARGLGANAIVVQSVAQSGTAGIGFNPAGGQMQGADNQAPLTVTAIAVRYDR